jgi:hypothetical protein
MNRKFNFGTLSAIARAWWHRGCVGPGSVRGGCRGHDRRHRRFRLDAAALLFARDGARLLGRHPGLSADELLELAGPAAGQIVTMFHSGGLGLVEAVAAGVSKGTAVAALAGRLGIQAREVVAFGDVVNDLPMLAWAGTSYGMANAHPAVLAQVDHVTGGNDEDGVAAVIEQLFADSL